MTRPAGALAIAGLVVTGGLTGASPVICPLPGPFIPQTFRAAPASVQTPSVTREDVDRLIDRLGSFDVDVRTDAARAIRRAPGTVALPALMDAASSHADSFVRRRALVLVSGYDDPRVPDQMELAAAEASDSLRTIAYRYFEGHPEPRLAPMLLKALPDETAEFARPALIRALAAHGRDLKVQRALLAELARASDGTRADTIAALGDHRASYAVKSLVPIARADGPFQALAVVALGRIGDKTTAPALAAIPDSTPQATRIAVWSALCLLGQDCEGRRAALGHELRAPDPHVGFQALVRAAASGLAELAVAGDVEAGRALIDAGAVVDSPTGQIVAEAVASLAIRRPDAIVPLLSDSEDRRLGLALVGAGLARHGDDFGEEQLFVRLRSLYFAEAEGSPRRELIQTLINTLEF
jgi:hypothetical protein